jgi:hypothetical protein
MLSESTCAGKGLQTIETLAKTKNLPVDFLRKLGLEDLPGGGIAIPYFDGTGEEMLRRQRDVPGGKRFCQPSGVKLQPYGLQRLEDARQKRQVFLCEGESDTWTMWAAGLPALGLPGASAAGCLKAADVECLDTIYVMMDSDQAGEQFAKRVQERLEKLGFTGKTFALSMPPGIKDVSELWVAHPGRDRFAQALAPQMETAQKVKIGMKEVRCEELSFESFPIQFLPEPWRSYVIAAAEAIGCDPALIAVPSLAANAGLVGNTRGVLLKPGWTEPCCIWAGVIGESGGAKSPAMDAALDPIRQLQKELHREFKCAMQEQNHEVGPGSKNPAHRRILAEDITFEKVCEMLHSNPRGLLLDSDEFANWFASFDRYRSRGKGGDSSRWLKLFHGRDLTIDRKTGDVRHIYIPRALVSVVGSIQPGVLKDYLTTELLNSGLAARCLLTHPPRRHKRWTEARVDERVAQEYRVVLRSILALQPQEKL